jgi:hypothetical protein
MRSAALALVVLCAAAAHADAVPIVVAPFAGRCFDAPALAERVRAQVGELPVLVGAPGTGSRQEVRVRARGGGLTVEVTARDSHGRVVGQARRLVPGDVDCATALAISALIVARAALPLTWREPPEHAAAPRRERADEPRASSALSPSALSPSASSPSAAATPSTSTSLAPAAPSPAPPTSPRPNGHPMGSSPRAASLATATSEATTSGASSSAPATSSAAESLRAAHAVDSGMVVLHTRGPRRAWSGELWAAAYGAFAVAGGAATAGGELAVGVRHRRFGVAVRGAVESAWDATAASSAGPLRLEVRRFAFGAEAHAAVGLRVGALRFAAGPTLPLYRVETQGTPRPRTSLVVSAAVIARVLYHLDLGPVFIDAGISCEVGLVREALTVTGAGVVARPPLVTLGPVLALGVGL